MPAVLRPAGGLLAQAGALLTAVEGWGRDLLADAGERAARDDPSRPDGPAFGLGALRAGDPDKSDLAPAALELYCYVVLPGPVSPGATAESLREHLDGHLDGVRIDVDEQLLGDGPGTPADASIIRLASASWDAEFGPAGPISGWTGSTDGVVLRAAGVPTARLGPRPVGGGDDPRVDTFAVAELLRFARVYEQVVCSVAAGE